MILQTFSKRSQSVAESFIELWNDPLQHTGFLYGRRTMASPDEVKATQTAFFKDILADTLGFAGMKMLRRIVGIAHVEDLESIKDADTRASCERCGISIAKYFIKKSNTISSIDEAIQIARDYMTRSAV